MLTSEQVAKARTFPGCGDITAENAADKLFLAAERLQASSASANGDNETLAAENKRLLGQFDRLSADLKASQANGDQIPKSVLRNNAKLARSYLNNAVTAQVFSPAVSEKIAPILIGAKLDDDEPEFSALGLKPDAKGDCIAVSVLEALASSGPAPTVGKDAKAQAVPKVQHGAIEGKSDLQQGLEAGQSYQQSQLAARGLK